MEQETKRGDALLKVSTEMVPSEDAQARIAPSSCGAQETEFTDALCRVCSLIFAHPAGVGPCAGCSFQMMTLPSYEHDARMCPNFGCAQATCHTGPVCLHTPCTWEVRCVEWDGGTEETHPLRTCPLDLVASPSTTSNTRTVLSDEHVASRFP